MKIVKAFLFLFVSLWLGSLIRRVVDYPIPDMIYGFTLLFLFLRMRIVKREDMECVSVPFIRLMPLFLVPACVKIVNSFEILQISGLRLLIVLMISFFCTMIAVSLTVQFLRRRIKHD